MSPGVGWADGGEAGGHRERLLFGLEHHVKEEAAGRKELESVSPALAFVGQVNSKRRV